MLTAHLRHAAALLVLAGVLAPLVVACVRHVAAAAPQAPRVLRLGGGAALTVALVQLLMTLLGTLGGLRLIPILLVLVGAGVFALMLAPAPERDRPGVGEHAGPARRAALAAVTVVAVQWSWWTGVALHQGVQRADSLTYHLPAALTYARTGSVRTPVMTTAGSPVGYYTDGMEVLHSVGIAVTRTDVVTCISGISFAALALVACYGIGARYGRGWLAVLLASVVLSAPAMVITQAGSALVDLPAAALVLTALALALWTDPQQPWSFLPTVLVAGAALGSKLLTLPVVLVVLAVVAWNVLRPEEGGRLEPHRVGIVVALGAASLLGTIPWLIRNAASAGSPLPMVNLPGFDKAAFQQVTDTGRSVLGYFHQILIYPGAGNGISSSLRSALGAGWPVFLVVAVVSAFIGYRQRRELPAVYACFIVAAVGYLVAPFGGGGKGRPPFLLTVNFRYGLTALLLLAVLVAAAARTERAARVVAGIGLVMLAVTALPNTVFPSHLSTYRLDTWPSTGRWAGVTIALLLAIAVWIGADLATGLARRVAPSATAVAIAMALVLAAAGFARSSIVSHYPGGKDLLAVSKFADGLKHERIGVVGIERSYQFAGRDLSNTVTSLVVVDDHGVPALPKTCLALLDRVRAARAQLVFAFSDPAASFDSAACLSMSAFQPLGRTGSISAWRVPAKGSGR